MLLFLGIVQPYLIISDLLHIFIHIIVLCVDENIKVFTYEYSNQILPQEYDLHANSLLNSVSYCNEYHINRRCDYLFVVFVCACMF